MTEVEKKYYPSSKTTEGYLKHAGKTDYFAWNNETELEFFKSLLGFDADIFLQITGIDVRASKTIKITHNGQEFDIDIEKAKELGILK